MTAGADAGWLAVAGAAAFAGVVAVGVTVAIERLGGALGGLLGTLPSTIVPASIGIHAASDTASFARAMAAVPVGMLLNALFLLMWRVLPPRLPRWSLGVRLGAMVALSLGAWAVAATLAVLTLQMAAEHALAAGVVAAVAMAGIGVLACLDNPPAPRGHRRVGPATLVARGLLAALAIAASVLVARSGADLAAGVASVFPAIFLTTMVSLWLSQGEAVPSGAVGPMMLGSTAVSGYALFAAFWIPTFGAVSGAGLSWLTAALTLTLPAWAWLRRGSDTT